MITCVPSVAGLARVLETNNGLCIPNTQAPLIQQLAVMTSSKPGFSHQILSSNGLKVCLWIRKGILLIGGLWLIQACALVEDDPPSPEEGESDVDAGGYELVIVDESVVSEGASTESVAEDHPADDATPAGINLPGAVVFDQEGDFTVQIAIYPGPKAARERVLELSKLGYPAYALGIRGESRVRVRIGYFTVRQDAERFGEIFKEDTGSDYWIDRRANEAP